MSSQSLSVNNNIHIYTHAIHLKYMCVYKIHVLYHDIHVSIHSLLIHLQVHVHTCVSPYHEEIPSQGISFQFVLYDMDY